MHLDGFGGFTNQSFCGEHASFLKTQAKSSNFQSISFFKFSVAFMTQHFFWFSGPLEHQTPPKRKFWLPELRDVPKEPWVVFLGGICLTSA